MKPPLLKEPHRQKRKCVQITQGEDFHQTKRRYSKPTTILKEDVKMILSHFDLTVITVKMGDSLVKRLLTDKNSSCDILFTGTLSKMGLEWGKSMSHTKTTLHFSRDKCPVVWEISLSLTLGIWPKAVTQKIHFSIIDLPTPYNKVLGRPSQDLVGIIITEG